MKRSTKILFGVGFLLGSLLFVATRKKKVGKFKEDNINLLLPAFRNKVLLLIDAMKQKGFDPVLHDTGRTQLEALTYAEKGVGVKNSLHLFGAATDIISASKGWKNPKFFQALEQEANKLNLTSGNTFRRKDPNHIQAIPIKYQVAFRKLTSPQARDLFINKYYSSVEKV
jgi:hypothetical protein